ncbi:response regulator transcription factor [candidate division KSB1 bacterium]|nr:response regulator transcription factor [candidate division KSB1 bacterium]
MTNKKDSPMPWQTSGDYVTQWESRVSARPMEGVRRTSEPFQDWKEHDEWCAAVTTGSSGKGGYKQAGKEPIRVLIVDDDSDARNALASILRPHPSVLVVGTAESGTEALQLAQELRPAVILMDAQMPGMDGAEATRRIKEQLPEIKVLCLLVHIRDIPTALAAGADAYMMKDAGRLELCSKIRALSC